MLVVDLTDVSALETIKTNNVCIVHVLVVDLTDVSALETTKTNNVCIVHVLVVDLTGDGCECKRDYCSKTNNICKNGGLCSITSTGGFSCSCQPGVSLVTFMPFCYEDLIKFYLPVNI